jgi:hypothetical protein
MCWLMCASKRFQRRLDFCPQPTEPDRAGTGQGSSYPAQRIASRRHCALADGLPPHLGLCCCLASCAQPLISKLHLKLQHFRREGFA